MPRKQKLKAFVGSEIPPLLMENPLTGGNMAIPAEVQLEGENLLWRTMPDELNLEGFVDGGGADAAIWKFVELHDAPEEEIFAFAQAYGVLAIRADGLPATAPATDPRANLLPPVEKKGDPPVFWYRESLQMFRMYAVGLRSIMAFAVHLREDSDSGLSSVIRKYGLDRCTWDSFGLPDFVDGSPSPAYLVWNRFHNPADILYNLSRLDSRQQAQQWIAWNITTTWLHWGGLSPKLVWREGAPRMTLTLGPRDRSVPLPNNVLPSVLAAQLAALVTSPEFERIDRCSVCGRLFPANRKPGRHERSFCPEHKLVGEQERKRRWARKQAAKRRAEGSG